MFTPRRPVKRRLFTTPFVTSKRARPNNTRNSRFNPATRFRRLNKFSSTGPSTRGTLTSQVKSLQRVVKNLAPEVKYVGANASATNIPTTGTVVLLTAIGQGDTQVTRTGNAVHVKSIELSGYFNRVALANDANAQFRIAIVVDKEQVADTAPTAGAIFASPDVPSYILPNLENLERFRILHISHVYDGLRFGLDSTAAPQNVPTQSPQFQYQWNGNLKVAFNGTTASDIEKNGVYLVVLSNIATGDFIATCRVSYTDV